MRLGPYRFSSYWIIFVAGLFICYKYFLQIFPTVISKTLMASFNLSGAAFGYLGGVFFISYLLLQLSAGPILDRFDARKVLAIAVSVCALGAVGFATGESFTMLWLSRALMGAGVAFATVGYMKLCSLYFKPEHFAFTSGLLTVGVMVGALFAQAPLALLIESTGWRDALWITATVGLALSLCFVLLLKAKPLAPLAQEHKGSLNLSVYVTLLKKSSSWYLLSYSGLVFAPLAVFGGLWGTPFISEAYDVSAAAAGGYVSCVYIGFGLGGPLCGFLSDRLANRLTIMKIGCVISAVCLFFIIYITSWSFVFLIILMIAFGLATGAFMLGFVVAKEAHPLALAASVVALINSGDAFYNTLTEPLIGYFLDLSWDGSMVEGARYFSVTGFQYAFSLFFLYFILSYLCLIKFERGSIK